MIEGADTQGMASDVAVPTLALGAFRGLVVDYLWVRTITLREQGRTYEARVLAEQIGRLQPRLPAVWDYLGSHLAYDLAATANDAETRWAWIQNGLDLVREQGLAKNPTSSRLCYTLSRIYQDKVNATMDDFHLDFKREHMLRMRRAGIHLASVIELASAPGLSALAAQDEAALEVLVAYSKLRGLGEISEIEPTLLCAAHHRYRYEGLPPADGVSPAEVAFLVSLEKSPAGNRVLISCAAQSLREIGFDPEHMRQVNADYGPLRWQSSFSAPIYWAAKGVMLAEAKGDVAQKVRCRRAALQGLKNAMRSGRSELQKDIAGGGKLIPLNLPNLLLIPHLERLYIEGALEAREDLKAMSKSKEFDVDAFRAAASFEINQQQARKDFLMEAVILLSEYGRDVEGKLLHARARKAYPEEPSFQTPYQDFLITIMMNRVTDTGAMDTVDTMTQGLMGLYQRAFTSLAVGEDDRFRTYDRLARARISRWRAYVRATLEEDPAAAQRLKVDVKQIYYRALKQAARQLRHVGHKLKLAQRMKVDPGWLLGKGARVRPAGGGGR